MAKLFFKYDALEGVGKMLLHSMHSNINLELLFDINLSIQPAQKVCPQGSNFGKRAGISAL